MFTLYVEDCAFDADELAKFAKRNKVSYVVEGYNEVEEWFQVTFSSTDREALEDVAYTFCLNNCDVK